MLVNTRDELFMEIPMVDTESKGRFIAIEGLDGAGKSTQITLLVNRLNCLGIETTVSREPTDGYVGCLVRQYLTKEIVLPKEVAAMLFAADRLDHLLNHDTGIQQAIMRGVTAISDRFVFSSYAYDGMQLPLEWLMEINALSTRILIPDVTIYLDVDPLDCAKRIESRGRSQEKYEVLDLLVNARQGFFQAFAMMKEQDKVIIIDGNNSAETISEQIWENVSILY